MEGTIRHSINPKCNEGAPVVMPKSFVRYEIHVAELSQSLRSNNNAPNQPPPYSFVTTSDFVSTLSLGGALGLAVGFSTEM